MENVREMYLERVREIEKYSDKTKVRMTEGREYVIHGEEDRE